MASKPKKGKQHAVKSVSFANVAENLRKHADDELVDTHSNRALLRLIANAFAAEGRRVRKIVR